MDWGNNVSNKRKIYNVLLSPDFSESLSWVWVIGLNKESDNDWPYSSNVNNYTLEVKYLKRSLLVKVGVILVYATLYVS